MTRGGFVVTIESVSRPGRVTFFTGAPHGRRATSVAGVFATEADAQAFLQQLRERYSYWAPELLPPQWHERVAAAKIVSTAAILLSHPHLTLIELETA